MLVFSIYRTVISFDGGLKYHALSRRLSTNLLGSKRPTSPIHQQKDREPLKISENKDFLSPEQFAHPDDIRLCQHLAQLPIINPITHTVFSTIEKMLMIEHLNNAILVGPTQLPSLHKSLLKACKILDMQPPDLYVKHNSFPNANTLAFRGSRPFILLNSGLLDLLESSEIEAVLGHELGHLKCDHGPWLSLLNMLTIIANSPFGVLLQPFRTLLYRWQCAAEFSCDRASFLVGRDFKIVSSVLMKLCGGSTKSRFQQEMNVDAFLSQSQLMKEELPRIALPLITIITQQTHLLPFERLQELHKWSTSKECSDIMSMCG